jgi:hypothetical protein
MQPAEKRLEVSRRSERPGVTKLVLSVCVAALGLEFTTAAIAQTSSLLTGGPPVQVVPYMPEPGVPQLVITPGTANPFAGADGSGGNGSGLGGTGGNVGGSDALSTMMDTSWGVTAVGNATSLGVNPSALAATCVLESGCSQPAGGSGAQGIFQMFPAAFQEGLQTALAANPSLASQIVQGSAGMNDPTTEAIAASGYLMQGASALANSGVSDPTVVQVRGYYQFGPADGTSLANASPDATLGSVLQHTSAATLAANGLSPSMTVAQYQATVAAKVGSAANQSVLT